MTLRKREGGGIWHNQKPITTIHQALELLKGVYGDSGKRYIYTGIPKPELHVEWYRQGSSGGDTSGTNHYEIDEKIVAELRQNHLIENLRIPRMGSTETVYDKFIISRYGGGELDRLNEEAKKVTLKLLKASELLEPDTKFEKEPHWPLWDDDNQLYFDVETTEEERFRVFPELKKVERTRNKRVPPMVSENGDLVTDPNKILRLMNSTEDRRAFISDPDKLRVDCYGGEDSQTGKRIHTRIFLYKIDPAMVVKMIWDGLLEPTHQPFKHECIPTTPFVLSSRGHAVLRDLKEKSTA